MLFRQMDGGYELIQSFTLVRNPVIVSANRTNGWNDLIVELSGGGAEATKVKLQFNGKTYPNIPDGVELAKSESFKVQKFSTMTILKVQNKVLDCI